MTLGMPELLVISGLVVLLFGARRLPGLARSVGTSIKELRHGIKEED
jgi:sec-independent protein translocase protein TatA